MAQRPGDPPLPSPTLTEREGYLEAVLGPTARAAYVFRQLEEIFEVCVARKPARLFVDFSPVSGTFSTLERYELGMIGARLAPYVGRVAVLLLPEVIDPEKFGAQVARNRGLHVDNFTDRDEALAWLLGP